MIDIDMRQVAALSATLKVMTEKGFPYAMRETLNDAAFATMEMARDNLADKMTLRNTWTQRQVIVERAKGTNPDNFAAKVGATVPYLRKQEFGGTVNHAIPTSFSSGEGYQHFRKKMPIASRKMKSIKLPPKQSEASRKAKNVAAVLSGEKFVWLDLGDRKGIFQVFGPSPKGKKAKARRPKMVWSMDGITRTIKAKPWLTPAFEQARPLMPEFFAKQAEHQIQRALGNKDAIYKKRSRSNNTRKFLKSGRVIDPQG